MENKGQVWIETVIYTLIGLVLIGTVLAFATPFINEQKDRAVLEKTAEAMNGLDNALLNVKGRGIDNRRDFSFTIGEGSLKIDSVTDKIIFQIDESRHEYSEPGIAVDIPGTNMEVRTAKNGNYFEVRMTLDYKNKIDITYKETESSPTLDAAPNPYLLIIENKGRVPVVDDSCDDVTTPCCMGGENPCEVGNQDGTCKETGFCVPNLVNINIYDAS